jgi:hypothetical protein
MSTKRRSVKRKSIIKKKYTNIHIHIPHVPHNESINSIVLPTTDRKTIVDYEFLEKDIGQSLKYEFMTYIGAVLFILADYLHGHNKNEPYENFKDIFNESVKTVDDHISNFFGNSDPTIVKFIKLRLMYIIWYALLDLFGLKRTKNITNTATNILRKAIAGTFGTVAIAEILHKLYGTKSLIYLFVEHKNSLGFED